MEGVSTAKAEFKAHWPMLLGATGACAVGASLFVYTQGYFVKPLESALHWSRSEIAFGATLAMLTNGLALPFVGLLTDRFGTRIIGIGCMVGYGLLCLMLASIPAQLILYYAAIVLVALVYSGATAVVFGPVVAANFQKSRGMALGILMSGTSLILAPLAPLFVHLVTEQGWRAGYVALSGAALLVGLPCAILAARGASGNKQPAEARTEGGGLGAALRTISFWKLAGAVVATTMPLGGFLHQHVALFTDRGVALDEVALLSSTLVVMVVIGRTTVGLLLDIFHPPTVTLAVMWAAGLSALVLAGIAGSIPLYLVVMGSIGVALGTIGNASAFLAARRFGLEGFSAIFGALGMCVSGGLGIGASVFGGIYDTYGDYTYALYFATASFFVGGMLFGTIPAMPSAPRAVVAVDPI